MDTPDKESAVNVMRINNAGIGFSTNGYNGPFTSAWTIDGRFVADFITAGTLNANLIRTGIIQGQTGGNYWNLDSGEFYTNTADRGLNIKDGRIYFYDPTDADFTSFISTNAISLDNNETATGIGMYSTNEWLEFGSIGTDGIFRQGVRIYTDSTTQIYGIPTGIIYAAQVKADYYYGSGINIVDSATPAYGEVKCRTVTQTSDERLKNVIEWDDRYIDALDDIEPVLYRWASGDSGVYAGFIAQRVKKALEAHGLDPSGIVEDGEYLTLHYDSIFTLLMAKVKRQQKKIEDLETRLERLEKILCE